MFCGSYFEITFNSETYVRWYDRWDYVRTEGLFDDANFSRAAYDTWQSEQALEDALGALPGQRSVDDILGSTKSVEEGRRWGWGIPIPNPGEILIPPIADASSDTWDRFVRQVRVWRAKRRIAKECRKAKVDPESCIAAMEDEVIGADAEESVADPVDVGGVWDPDQMDEDRITRDDSEIRAELPVLVIAVTAAGAPGRWQCSYTKSRFNSPLLYYHGITSGPGSSDCTTAVRRRSQQHDRSRRFRRQGLWAPSVLDKQIRTSLNLGVVTATARELIRGREQHLIDTYSIINPNGSRIYGIEARRTQLFVPAHSPLFNRIRSIWSYNPFGCVMWGGAKILWGPRAPYTGKSPRTCSY